jgi:hypothetical protein
MTTGAEMYNTLKLVRAFDPTFAATTLTETHVEAFTDIPPFVSFDLVGLHTHPTAQPQPLPLPCFDPMIHTH